MSVKVRPYRRGGWHVDIRLVLPDGKRFRQRTRIDITSKSAAQRWGEARERHLLIAGRPPQKREVPTLSEFAPRSLDGHVRANRQKPSGIAATESIVKWHLRPVFGAKRLDAITNEQVQKLKFALAHRAPKTVNNVLTVLSTLLKKAVEWGDLDRLPCTIKLLANPKRTMGFHGLEEYERLLTVAQKRSPEAHLMVLLGGDAGLRLGEIVGLEWKDVDLHARRLAVQRSDWCGHVTVPKSGRSRRLPMTLRLTAALKAYGHLRSDRVLCLEDAIRLLDGPAEAGRHGRHADLDEDLEICCRRDRPPREVLAQERSWLAKRSSELIETTRLRQGYGGQPSRGR
jgi:integrase